eukprot:4776157-Amphidinium_carterae.4
MEGCPSPNPIAESWKRNSAELELTYRAGAGLCMPSWTWNSVLIHLQPCSVQALIRKIALPTCRTHATALVCKLSPALFRSWRIA